MTNAGDGRFWIAVVDDDESVRGAVYGALKSVGLQARAFASAQEFLDAEQLEDAACLIADIQMPGMNGLELQATLARRNQPIPVIFMTAFGDRRIREQAWRGGALAFLDKPFDDNVLLETVRSALERAP